MADKKISQLSSAATPLAGTEILPIVQSSATVKVAVSDLTAGRNVAVGATVSLPRTLSVGGSVALERFNATPQIAIRGGTDSTTGLEYRFSLTQTNGLYISNAVIGGSQLENWFFRTNGDFTVNTGNLVMGTAGKGIDFTQSTNAAGMTSELLNDYEEGTFTPVVADADTGGNTATGTFTGNYTKIGRIVHVTLQLGNINTTGMTAGNNLIVRGLPFTAVTFNQYPCPIAWANLTTGGNIISGSVLGATASLYLVTSLNSANNGYIKVSAVTSGSCNISVNVTYQV